MRGKHTYNRDFICITTVYILNMPNITALPRELCITYIFVVILI